MSNTFNLFKTILSIVTTNPIFLTKIYFTSIKFLMKKYTMLYKVFFFHILFEKYTYEIIL